MDFFHVFRGEMKILEVDLKSASKISTTIREQFMENKFFSKNFFFQVFEPEKLLRFHSDAEAGIY